MRIDVVTLFPDFIRQSAALGVVGRAAERGLLHVEAWNPRDYATDGYRRVDDRPFGGGPGMVMNAGPVAAAVAASKQALGGTAKVVALSPQGEPLTQQWVKRLAAEQGLVVLCGRYEGVDERLVASAVDVELSLGDFVLSGGELAAMVLIDGIARLLPGVLGHAESAGQDSFSSNGLLDHPHYSRPEVWRDQAVPDVLMSGNHAALARWRLKQALGRTWLRRPDLLDKLELDAEQQNLLREFVAEQKAGGS